jgi:hypothetical protein
LWLLLTIIALAATASGVYLSYNGLLSQYVPLVPDVAVHLTPTPTHTATPTFTPESMETLTPADNLVATEIAQTLNALSALVTTPINGTPTPDMTATVASCDYDYRVVSQIPSNGTLYPASTTLTMEIVIRNDSRCVLGDDTRLVFREGFQLRGPNFIAFDDSLAPGEEMAFELDLRTPPYDEDRPVVRSTWAIELEDGTQVGPPLVLSLELFSPDEGTPAPTPEEDAGTTPPAP